MQDDERLVEDVVSCPLCGARSVSWTFHVVFESFGWQGSELRMLFIKRDGFAFEDLHADLSKVPRDLTTEFSCANGHRWRMGQRRVDGVIAFDRWDEA